jgi:hypothetical protein
MRLLPGFGFQNLENHAAGIDGQKDDSELAAKFAAALFAGGFAQRGVDAVLPARTVLLNEVEHVAIDAQRDLLFHAGNCRRRFRRSFDGLCCRRFEGLLGGGAGIVGASCHVDVLVKVHVAIARTSDSRNRLRPICMHIRRGGLLAARIERA